MSFVKKITDALSNMIKAALREYLHETEAALKKRLQKLLIMSIITGILVSLVISFLGSASLFILIGSLKYLSTTMPAWKAWYIIGITSGIVGGILFLVLFIIMKKQLKSL